VATIGVLTGGFSADELRAAGAIAVFESVQELRERLSETPLGS
jgi:phosphoglycolate phosphatase-like HAD superfamily hydrolase